MRTLVLGAGATGGYFGGRLAHAGRDVTFLVRAERAAQLAREGLQLQSPSGDVTLQPRLLGAAELRDHPPFDLVILATKAYSLPAALEDLAPAVGPSTALLPILNGMLHLDLLVTRFGPAPVLGGSCRIITDLTSAGVVEQRTTLSELHFGELPGAPTSDRIARLTTELSVPGITSLPSGDILAIMWQKWWILASIGAVCTLARGTTGQAFSAPFGPELLQAIVAECTTIAQENGYPPDPGMLADHHKRLGNPRSTLTSSMYRDMLRGRPVEADHILGDLLARAQAHSTPLLAAAYTQLKVYEAARPASELPLPLRQP